MADLTDGFGLVTQEPWIQYATVRDNILFGLPYDVDKYNAVLYACALEEVSTDDFSLSLYISFSLRIYVPCLLEI